MSKEENIDSYISLSNISSKWNDRHCVNMDENKEVVKILRTLLDYYCSKVSI